MIGNGEQHPLRQVGAVGVVIEVVQVITTGAHPPLLLLPLPLSLPQPKSDTQAQGIDVPAVETESLFRGLFTFSDSWEKSSK
jgi:hypothetical protein